MMRTKPDNKKHAAELQEYAAATVAMRRMHQAVEDKLAQLYYAMQRQDISEVRYRKAARALARRDR